MLLKMGLPRQNVRWDLRFPVLEYWYFCVYVGGAEGRKEF